jgi:hypothetical protein
MIIPNYRNRAYQNSGANFLTGNWYAIIIILNVLSMGRRFIPVKLNLDKELIDLKGNPIPEKLSDILANMLAMATTGPPAKMITWAVNLTNEAEIEVDKTDVKFLSSFVNENRTVVNLAKSQLLDEIEKLNESR